MHFVNSQAGNEGPPICPQHLFQSQHAVNLQDSVKVIHATDVEQSAGRLWEDEHKSSSVFYHTTAMLSPYTLFQTRH